MHGKREQSGVEVPLEEVRGSWPRWRQDVDGGVGAPRARESATPEMGCQRWDARDGTPNGIWGIRQPLKCWILDRVVSLARSNIWS